MSDKTIHQSLLELEENLKSLESARKQVINVTTSSEKLIEAFTRILAQLEKLNESFDTNNNEVLASFDNVIKKMNSTLEEESNKRIIDNENIQNSLTEAVEKTIKILEYFNVAIEGMAAKMNEFNFNEAFSQIDIKQEAIISNQNNASRELSKATIDIKNQTNLLLEKIDKNSKRNLIVSIAGIITIIAITIIL